MAEFAAVAVQALHKMSGQIRVAKIAKPIAFIAFIGDSDSNVIQNPELGPDSDKKVSGKTVGSTHTWLVRFGIASC